MYGTDKVCVYCVDDLITEWIPQDLENYFDTSVVVVL